MRLVFNLFCCRLVAANFFGVVGNNDLRCNFVHRRLSGGKRVYFGFHVDLFHLAARLHHEDIGIHVALSDLAQRDDRGLVVVCRDHGVFAASLKSPDSAAWLRQTLLQPRFDQDALDRVRGQILSSLMSDLKDPQSIAGTEFEAMAYGDHPYANYISIPRFDLL